MLLAQTWRGTVASHFRAHIGGFSIFLSSKIKVPFKKSLPGALLPSPLSVHLSLMEDARPASWPHHCSMCSGDKGSRLSTTHSTLSMKSYTPTHNTPTHYIPKCDTPIHYTPVHDMPVHGTPVHALPVHGTPVCNTPTCDMPVHDTPVHGTPTCNMSVHDMPVHDIHDISPCGCSSLSGLTSLLCSEGLASPCDKQQE